MTINNEKPSQEADMTEEIQHLTAAEERSDEFSSHLGGAELPHEEPSSQEPIEEMTPSTREAETELKPEPETETVRPNRDTDSAVAEALFASSVSPTEAETQPEAAAAEPEPTPSISVPAAAPEAVAAPSPRSGRANLAVIALSDVGCVRTNNEDAYGYDPELGIFVICDGMGGMAAGEVASSNAVASLVNTFAESAGTDLPVGTRLQQAVHTANHTVWEMGQQPEHKGMGTTTVAAALDGTRLIIANVGDSRAYMLQDGRATQVTVDHSYINELIRNGTLTPENAHLADLHGYESVITRAIGVSETVEPDYYSLDLVPGMQILLATDGLTRYLQGGELEAILQATPFESACANLIDLAKHRGGHDNITCLLMQVLPDEAAPQPAQ